MSNICPNCGGPEYPRCCGAAEEPDLYSETVRFEVDRAPQPFSDEELAILQQEQDLGS
jgi:hypothetical protein